MSRAFIAIRAVLWASLFVAVWTWAALAVRSADFAAGRFLPFAVVFPGLALAACGAVLVLSCLATFAFRGDGTPAPFDPPRRFVTSGPYRWVRNPMYLGALAILAGCGFAFRSPSVVVLAALAWVLAHGFAVLIEEPGLERRFGETYRVYRRATNRWIPRPPRGAPAA